MGSGATVSIVTGLDCAVAYPYRDDCVASSFAKTLFCVGIWTGSAATSVAPSVAAVATFLAVFPILRDGLSSSSSSPNQPPNQPPLFFLFSLFSSLSSPPKPKKLLTLVPIDASLSTAFPTHANFCPSQSNTGFHIFTMMPSGEKEIAFSIPPHAHEKTDLIFSQSDVKNPPSFSQLS